MIEGKAMFVSMKKIECFISATLSVMQHLHMELVLTGNLKATECVTNAVLQRYAET